VYQNGVRSDPDAVFFMRALKKMAGYVWGYKLRKYEEIVKCYKLQTVAASFTLKNVHIVL
jgi:hypothetical protein